MVLKLKGEDRVRLQVARDRDDLRGERGGAGDGEGAFEEQGILHEQPEGPRGFLGAPEV